MVRASAGGDRGADAARLLTPSLVLVLGVSSGSLDLRMVEHWLSSVAAAPEM